MDTPAYRWRDFPFGVAGPISLLANAGVSTAGLLTLLVISPHSQLWVGAVAFFAIQTSVWAARRAFANRRRLSPSGWWLPPGSLRRLLILAAGVLPVAATAAFGWTAGAVWLLFGMAFYAQELVMLLVWRAHGYPGADTSGWALDDRRTEQPAE